MIRQLLITEQGMLVDYSSDEGETTPDDQSHVIKVPAMQSNSHSQQPDIQANLGTKVQGEDLNDGPLSKRKPTEVKLLQKNVDLFHTLEVSRPVMHLNQTKPAGGAKQESGLKPVPTAAKPKQKLLPSQVRLKKPNMPIDI